MKADARIRLLRAATYPENAILRQLYIKTQITEWICYYPPPSTDVSLKDFREWEKQSDFSLEETQAGYDPLCIKDYSPIAAYALAEYGREIVDQPQEKLPMNQPTWFLIGANHRIPTTSEVEKVSKIRNSDTKVQKNQYWRLYPGIYYMQCILGAVCFDKGGNIISCLKWSFDEHGPSVLFRDIYLTDKNCTLLSMNYRKERATAIRIKLHKQIYEITLAPLGKAMPEKIEKFRKPSRKKRNKTQPSQTLTQSIDFQLQVCVQKQNQSPTLLQSHAQQGMYDPYNVTHDACVDNTLQEDLSCKQSQTGRQAIS